VLQAQRYAAWGEVARRLAHEIKNPLTPIQLSAERIEHRLAEKLTEDDSDMLRRATKTIVNQVAALKSMVDAFSQYARTPETKLQVVDLNLLVQEILLLYESQRPPIRRALHAGLRPVQGDPARLRQVIHNLLQNAQQAVGDQPDAQIDVRTEPLEEGARIIVEDNGPGFPAELLGRLFEPYVTTKTKGTGLGLAIVKRIVEEHNGKIELQNRTPRGANVGVTIPWAKIQQPLEVLDSTAKVG
jgi:nitrogen fixation/metabolism regulation signal transduction histidine kinase